MDSHHWQRIEEVYYSALPLPPSQRATYVANACQNDPALQQQVESLLEADDSSGDFLETAIFEMGLRILASDSSRDLATVTDPVTQGLAGVTLDGRYGIERELGHGGVGVVYLARDQKLHNKPVVVKVLLEKSLNNKWIAQKFLQEKEALARVDHPGVVGILDSGRMPDGEPYLVMQFVDGMSLREAIKDQPEGVELVRAASIIRQVGAALNAVHERNIYHRDLKPENIMLQDLGRGEAQVKILDFGIAKVKESLIAPSTATGMGTAGTIVYMSPEHLRGEKVTSASDIYSLGVMAYEIVTGRRPFNPSTIAHLAEMQRHGVRVRPTDLRPRLSVKAERMILRALDYDPTSRFQNAAEFGDELARALVSDEEEGPATVAAYPVPAAALPGQITTPALAETITTPPNGVTTFGNAADVAPEKRRSRGTLFAVAAIVISLMLGSYLLIANREKLFGVGTKGAERSLVYSLTVQKMRDGKSYQDPFQSSGQEVFENGYKFRLNFSSPQSGYLYVFNEGATETGALNFAIIYPTPATNQGSAKVEANQPIQTNWNTFAGNAGTEDFWIVWSASSIAPMEAARDAAFRNQGTLGDAAMVRTVREFLTKNADPKLETTKDTMRQQTLVRGSGDALVKLVELEHR